MHYPLSIRFKLAAISSQISVRDAEGNEQFYVKQKLFKLKESIEVYRDHSKSELLYTIKADKIIDFSPLYTMTDRNGVEVGSIKRQGRRSLWSVTYDIAIGGQPVATVKETNPWTKVLDSLLGEIPILGLLSSYVLQPQYSVLATAGNTLASLKKKPAFFEGRFELEDAQLNSLPDQSQYYLAVLLMMVALMERMRG